MTWKLDATDNAFSWITANREVIRSFQSGCQVMRTKPLFCFVNILCWSLNFSFPAWKRMKSCYSSTELATRVAFVVRKAGNFGEGSNSNFIFIIGHLNSFWTCKESGRFLLFLVPLSPSHSPCASSVLILMHVMGFFLSVWDLAQWGCLFSMCIHILLYSAKFHFAFFLGTVFKIHPCFYMYRSRFVSQCCIVLRAVCAPEFYLSALRVSDTQVVCAS